MKRLLWKPWTFMSVGLLALLCLLVVLPLLVAQTPNQNMARHYSELQVMIPMRDGTHLNTMIYIPKKGIPKYKNSPLPILIYRTPYGIPMARDGSNYFLKYNFSTLAQEEYIFVFQDIRGRFDSEGDFVFDRPPRDKNDANSVDEATDANDTIDWLIANIPMNNSRIGMIGDSYSGWLVLQALIDPHPALKSAIILGCNADYWIGDDLFHFGALRLSMGFEFAYMMENSRTNSTYPFGGVDVYNWFLNLGPLSNVNRNHFFGQYPTWNDLMAHPNYDDFWKKHAVETYLTQSSIPTLFVAGFWDAVDFYGPLKMYEILEQNDTQNNNFLVIGPWRHGGWWYGAGDSLGPLTFGSRTNYFYQTQIEAPWLAHHLKAKGNLNLRESTVFMPGENSWRQYDTWPPETGVEIKNLYFKKNGMLEFDPPITPGNLDFVSYVSDPSDPVPYTERPIDGFLQGSFEKWKIEDQQFLVNRPDVVRWSTPALETDVTISGRLIADFYASTSGTDSDWIVKIIDVIPEAELPPSQTGDYQFMVADEVLRAKYRNSFTNPTPLVSHEITHYQIDLNCHSYCFKAGHKIMVQMQSSWFPLIDRNPHAFLDIPDALAQDYQAATQKIYFTSSYPSHIKLPVHQPNSR
ncbi:CocE/NonD family hydrolase [Acidobacteriota bacterium]